ncbi:MAG: glycosyltransferase family 2 protein [Sphingobacteriaceae bacterium]|nr:glycosyltransferase family 2 protein [Sphingobacteriaceae bacterium]
MSTFESIVNNSIFFYALLLILSVVTIVFISSFEINKYLRTNSYINYKELLVSPHAPSISVISPVFNIEEAVVNHVRALFALQYNNFEIIIVNDGSTDNTLEKLKEFYQLENVNFAVYEQLKTQAVHSYYKSKNPAFAKLTVIDKAFGGKPDALNAGLNTSEKELTLCIEVDCFLDKNSLLKLVKPFLENKKRVIAAGTAVHVANSSGRNKGHLLNAKFPGKLLPGLQALEYFKWFLIERLTSSSLNGAHVITGAAGLFDKEILIQSGGYSLKALKEGFELIVRMCRYMHDNGLQYRVVFIPDPLCWVEAPANLKALAKQRKQWAGGNSQIFWLNKDLFFNKNYGLLGLVHFPYWFLHEWITPFFKVITLFLLGALAVTGKINWEYLCILFLMIYFFAVLLSAISVLYEEKSYRQYSSSTDIFRIVALIFVAPVIYHPLTVYWKVMAYIRVKN